MATVKYGNGIVAVSGKIAGNVFGRDRNGSRVRAMARRVKQRTSTQAIQRDAFRTCLNYLQQNVSETLYRSWEQFAKITPWTNRIGQPVYLHWRHWFMRINTMRVRNGLAIDPNPPE